MSNDEQYAKDRQDTAQRSVNEKLKCNVQQIKDMILTKSTYILNTVSTDIQTISNIQESVSQLFNTSLTTVISSAYSLIDNALTNTSGLLGQLLKETAISEKLNEIKSEVTGLVTQSQVITRGLTNKVSNLNSINNLIRYDNFSNTANRVNDKNTIFKDNTSLLFSVVKTGDTLLGIANSLLSLIGNGLNSLGVSFPSFSQFPKYDMSKFVSPIPQISCPSLPSIQQPTDNNKNDERTTVHAVKCVKNGTKQSNNNIITDLIKSVGETVGLATQFTTAINNIGSAISEIENSVPKNLFNECYDICETFAELGLDCDYTTSDIDSLLSQYGLNKDYGFSWGSDLSSRYDLDKINPSLQTSLTNVSNLYTYANTNLETTTNVTTSTNATVGIPNDTEELKTWLEISTPTPTPETTTSSETKSTTEPISS